MVGAPASLTTRAKGYPEVNEVLESSRQGVTGGILGRIEVSGARRAGV